MKIGKKIGVHKGRQGHENYECGIARPRLVAWKIFDPSLKKNKSKKGLTAVVVQANLVRVHHPHSHCHLRYLLFIIILIEYGAYDHIPFIEFKAEIIQLFISYYSL